MDQPTHSQPAAAAKRKTALKRLALAVLIAGVAAGGYEVFGSRGISTDNAYTAVETAQITAATSGLIAEIRVNDTQKVSKGDLLVVIDPADARLRLAEAEAELGRAERRVRGYLATDASLAAQVAARSADEKKAAATLESAEADLERARVDLGRRQALAGSGAVSGDELSKSENAFANAQAAVAAARAATATARSNWQAAVASRDANAALIAGSDEAGNPEVVLARTRRDQARLDLERTQVAAPVDGIVARRQVQLGQRVASGTPLLSVVPVQDIHVDANFKESQLEQVRVGQRATLRSDLYGSAFTYHGVVEGFSGGTGAAFAAIPAQNASGNWIKVVQRVPVRIRLDRAELDRMPLKVGLSMSVQIDTRGKAD